jgi:hypothetical protein
MRSERPSNCPGSGFGGIAVDPRLSRVVYWASACFHSAIEVPSSAYASSIARTERYATTCSAESSWSPNAATNAPIRSTTAWWTGVTDGAYWPPQLSRSMAASHRVASNRWSSSGMASSRAAAMMLPIGMAPRHSPS